MAQWSSTGSTVYYDGGHVCVGTATPSWSKFVVVTPDGGSQPQIAAQAGGTAQGQRAVFSFFPTFQGTSDNTPRRAADIVGGFNNCAWGCEYLSFNVGSGGSTNDVGALTNEQMRITAAGNVGIGTANPHNRLEVDGPSIGIGSGPNHGIQFLNPGVQHVGLRYDGFGNLIYEDASITYDPATWYDGMPANFIVRNGKVGIDTTAPQYPLSVNGTIQAKEVIVNTGWSDYVFNPGYKLMSLPQVATYIKQNRHLPGIPSAAEVRRNGVNLGEMQSKLLATVEKLTLQVIQLQEEVNELQNKD